MSYNIGERVKLIFDTNRTDDKEVVGTVRDVTLGEMMVESDGDVDPDYVYHENGNVDLVNDSTSQYAEDFGSNAEVSSP